MAFLKLSELLGLPETLTESERNDCVMLANHYGVSAAQEQAKCFILRHIIEKKYPTSREMVIVADYLEQLQRGAKLLPKTLESLRALGYVFGEPPAVTMAGKSVVKTHELKRLGN